MDRNEFLLHLRSQLQSEMSAGEIEENIEYYRTYIEEQIGLGRSEEDVLEDLGGPEILARSLLAAREASGQGYRRSDSYDGSGRAHERQERRAYSTEDMDWRDRLRANATLIGIIFAFVVVLILVVGLVSGIVRLIAPILVPVLILWFCYRLLTRSR